jgi:tRNA-dihydrouridine synthase
MPKAPFEEISKKGAFGISGNYITYTEFVSADGLVLAPEAGRKKLLKDLEYSEIERPIVAQFFTSKPEMMEKAAALAVELNFDGVDINMGCPDRNVEKQGAGAALIKNPKLARELIIAAKRGVQRSDLEKCPKGQTFGIPVSVKTRLGYNKDELETWLPELLAENPAAIIIHTRTRKEMSKAPARWERIKKAVEIRNEIQSTSSPTLPLVKGKGEKNDNDPSSPFPSPASRRGVRGEVEHTLIIGNGDVADTDDARKKCEETGADGAMLGRAIFGRPWLLSNSYEWFNRKNDSEVIKKILEILVEHTKLFEEKFEGVKNFALMKKHFKSYLAGIPNTRELRGKLMETENLKEVEELISKFLYSLN